MLAARQVGESIAGLASRRGIATNPGSAGWMIAVSHAGRVVTPRGAAIVARMSSGVSTWSVVMCAGGPTKPRKPVTSRSTTPQTR